MASEGGPWSLAARSVLMRDGWGVPGTPRDSASLPRGQDTGAVGNLVSGDAASGAHPGKGGSLGAGSRGGAERSSCRSCIRRWQRGGGAGTQGCAGVPVAWSPMGLSRSGHVCAWVRGLMLVVGRSSTARGCSGQGARSQSAHHQSQPGRTSASGNQQHPAPRLPRNHVHEPRGDRP